MARLPRLTVPGHSHHVIQRGNNRQPIVRDDQDRQALWDQLLTQSRAFGVAVHAYVLMDNHLHLLLTPERLDSLPGMMQAVGRSHVRRFNQRWERTGTLWEGRYKNTVIQAERHLLACMAYIDLNPVRAGLVEHPADFGWSSHLHLIGRRVDPLVAPHPLFWAMGNTPFAREAAYSELVRHGLGAEALRQMTKSVHSGWALGDEAFVEAVQAQTTRRVRPQTPGRPRKSPSAKDCG